MSDTPPVMPALARIGTSLQTANWRNVAVTLAVGTAGAIAFSLFGLPAAFLSGSMVAVAASGMLRIPTEIPDAVRDLCFFAIGLAMGAGVSPDSLARAVQWPLSLAILTLAVFAIGTGVFVFLHRIAGWDGKTAFYACIPGALTFVMALAERSEADVRFVAVSQSIRLFFLVAILPIVLIGTSGGAPPSGPEGSVMAIGDGAMLVGFALVTTILFIRLKVPAATMVGPFMASVALFATGIVSGALHPVIINGALIVLGGLIGARFGSIEWPMLRRLVLASVGALMVGLTIAVAFSALTVVLTGLDFGQVLLAFAPGGLEAMVILAFLFDLDPAYVAAHQVARLVGMMLFLPVIVALMGRRV